MAKVHPEALHRNLDLIGVYGRYDDLYCLIGTPLEDEMWAAMKHDAERYGQFIQKAVNGEEKIHSVTLYPYDIVEKVMEMGWTRCRIREDETLEAQWRALPDYVEEGANALVIADTSGSMHGRPMATSVGLAVYFAERNTGAYENQGVSVCMAILFSLTHLPFPYIILADTLAYAKKQKQTGYLWDIPD